MADLSQLNVNNNDYNLKDAAARNDIQSTQVVTGNPITLTDCAPINAESLKVKLEPKQEGSGDPSPTNIRPITGYTQTSVEGVGKNLIDITQSEKGGIDSSGQLVSDNNLRRSTNYIAANSGDKVTFSAKDGYVNSFRIYYYDENLDFIRREVDHTTYTIPANCEFIKWSLFHVLPYDYTDTVMAEMDLMLEKGDAQTEYEPYASTSATIQFGQTVYGGSVDFKTGKLTITNVMDIDTWGNYSNATDLGSYVRKNKRIESTGMGINNDSNAVSNVAPNVADYSSDSLHFYVSAQAQATAAYVFMPEDTSNDTEIEICYTLATPLTIQLTPQQLALLKGTNNLTADGVMQIGYQPDNVIGEVKGEIQDLWDYILSQGE